MVSAVGRASASGRTRVCPHCKQTILESAVVCPGCQHHLRFDPKALAEGRARATFSALKVEGGFRHPVGGDAWEYSIVISVRNDRGEEIERKIVAVGALQPNEGRSVTLSVDVYTPPPK